MFVNFIKKILFQLPTLGATSIFIIYLIIINESSQRKQIFKTIILEMCILFFKEVSASIFVVTFRVK